MTDQAERPAPPIATCAQCGYFGKSEDFEVSPTLYQCPSCAAAFRTLAALTSSEPLKEADNG